MPHMEFAKINDFVAKNIKLLLNLELLLLKEIKYFLNLAS